jgi:hypothetical protein
VRKIIRTGLARSGDPITSHEAADSVTGTLNASHIAVIDWLRSNAPATDDQIAEAMVNAGVTAKHEQARRLVRTCRERYGIVVPAMLDGCQIELVNTSGRLALAWKVAK